MAPKRQQVFAWALGGGALLGGCFDPAEGGPDSTTGTGTTTSASSVTSPTSTSNTTGATLDTSASITATTSNESSGADGVTSENSVTAADASTTAGETTLASETVSGTTGCGDTGGTTGDLELDPPQLMAVEFITTDTVHLTFSEALAPTDAVQPEQFRLSYGHSRYQPGPNPMDYFDLGYMDNVAISVTEIEFDTCNPIELILHLDGDLSMGVCDIVAAWQDPNGQSEGGIFVHFSGAGIPAAAPVEDVWGNDFADISAAWVLAAPALDYHFYTYDFGHFPHMIPFLPIPCP
jgi:hypothetical protein